MRLDHLLSKETSSKPRFACNVLRSDFLGRRALTLFNLEGTRSLGTQAEPNEVGLAGGEEEQGSAVRDSRQAVLSGADFATTRAHSSAG